MGTPAAASRAAASPIAATRQTTARHPRVDLEMHPGRGRAQADERHDVGLRPGHDLDRLSRGLGQRVGRHRVVDEDRSLVARRPQAERLVERRDRGVGRARMPCRPRGQLDAVAVAIRLDDRGHAAARAGERP